MRLGTRRFRGVQRSSARNCGVPHGSIASADVEDAVVIAPPSPVAIADVVRIARGARLVVADGVWPRVEAAHAQFVRLQASDRLVYGVNTGCGPLCEHLVPLAEVAAFQANLVRSHASGLGAWHPREVARATLAVRALTLAHGRSGVRRAVVETLVALRGSTPHGRIPARSRRRRTSRGCSTAASACGRRARARHWAAVAPSPCRTRTRCAASRRCSAPSARRSPTYATRSPSR
jgi:hypothetical protein